MSKDKSHMSHRYIELFLNSSPGPSPVGNSGGMLGGIGNFCGGIDLFNSTNYKKDENFWSLLK